MADLSHMRVMDVWYADQSERDHEVLLQAVREGRLEVFIEEE